MVQPHCYVRKLLRSWRKNQLLYPGPYNYLNFASELNMLAFTLIRLNMTLETQIMDQLKQAMRDKNEAALRTLRAIKAAILVEKTAAGAKGELTEADELKMLQKLVKQRRDSLDIFRAQQREDLAKTEEEEIAIIERFLPQQLSNEALLAKVKEIIALVGATSPADMGKVMGAASKQLAGQADGKQISEAVKQLLAS